MSRKQQMRRATIERALAFYIGVLDPKMRTSTIETLGIHDTGNAAANAMTMVEAQECFADLKDGRVAIRIVKK